MWCSRVGRPPGAHAAPPQRSLCVDDGRRRAPATLAPSQGHGSPHGVQPPGHRPNLGGLLAGSGQGRLLLWRPGVGQIPAPMKEKAQLQPFPDRIPNVLRVHSGLPPPCHQVAHPEGCLQRGVVLKPERGDLLGHQPLENLSDRRCRPLLGSPTINSKSGPSQVEPNPNRTQNYKIPITKPNHIPQVTWTDIARKEPIQKNDTTIARPQDSHGWRGAPRRYATRLAGLTG